MRSLDTHVLPSQVHLPDIDADTLDDIARGLGWFSIGLGLAELVAPRTLTRALGMEKEAEIVRAYGLREIVAGVGLLTQKDPTPWLWGRVAGDVLDLATLAIGMDKRNPQKSRVGMALGVVGAITLLDVAVAAAAGAPAARLVVERDAAARYVRNGPSPARPCRGRLFPWPLARRRRLRPHPPHGRGPLVRRPRRGRRRLRPLGPRAALRMAQARDTAEDYVPRGYRTRSRSFFDW